MDHEAAQASFSDYVDGELAASEKDRVDEHLKGCDACRAELDDMRRTLAALRGVKSVAAAPEASPEFVDNLRSQINTRSKGRFFSGKKRSYGVEIASLITLVVATTIYVVLSLVSPMWLVR